MAAYIHRLVDPWLRELVDDTPGVMVVGPRASGKTTSAMRLAKTVLRLDNEEVRLSIEGDPDAVLGDADAPVLVDEWQLAPTCLAAAKRLIDTNPSPGSFVFTGSATDTLTNGTWAGTGRFVCIEMWGLTQREILGTERTSTFFDIIAAPGFDGNLALPVVIPDTNEYVDLVLNSGFPEALARTSERTRLAWLDSYVDHLVGRDIELIAEVRDIAKLRRYLAAIASNTAGVPNLQVLLGTASIDRETANRFDGLLERIFVTQQIPAWTSNRLTRVGSRRKRYLCEPALLAPIIGVDRRSIVRNADLLGRVIDSFVVSQLRPEMSLGQFSVSMHHLRQDGKHEIDLILERRDGAIVAVEVKAGTTVDRHDARHLIWLRDQLDPNDFRAGIVFHTGKFVRKIDDRIWAVPVCAIWG
jgi:uncharacterized protein